MNQASIRHDRAMELADQADSLLHRGEHEQSIEIYRGALAEEEAALHLSVEEGAGVKTLSVLHRSAASLAMDCRDWTKARKFILQGLLIRPPKSVEEELMALLTKLPLVEEPLRKLRLVEEPTFELEVSRSESENTLDRNVEIHGSLRAANDLTFDGNLEGEIIVVGELTLGKNAEVRGVIKAGSVKLFGRIHGNIFVRDTCKIFSRALLVGNVRATRLLLEEGAAFVGLAEIVPMRLGGLIHLSDDKKKRSIAVPG